VDHGPSKWESRDVWEEIGEHLKKNDVRAAAALLRHYLEYISRELCHRLRAPVAFRGDARYDLGDLLPSATSRFKKLLGEGQQASKSWNNGAALNEVTEHRLAFETALARSSLESWQINPAIHYNEWKNFNRQDFGPVVSAFRDLLRAFFALPAVEFCICSRSMARANPSDALATRRTSASSRSDDVPVSVTRTGCALRCQRRLRRTRTHRCARVVDGDTIELAGKLATRVVLLGNPIATGSAVPSLVLHYLEGF